MVGQSGMPPKHHTHTHSTIIFENILDLVFFREIDLSFLYFISNLSFSIS